VDTPILTEIKTDVIQGHIPAAKDKIKRVGLQLGNDWMAMALVTLIDKYLSDIMSSDSPSPSTTLVEVTLATLDARLSDTKFIFKGSTPNPSMRLYLTMESSKKLDVPYHFHDFRTNKIKETVFVKFSAKEIYASTYPNSWDVGQKNILLPLIEQNKSLMLESTTSSGHWKIISVFGG
tara:strand:+ start:56 stop:589 length:534 start_codon:yes stop_codon:yes gene_type:complete